MSYLIFVLSSMVVLIALATLLHIQFGLTGIVNFGVAGFWGVGLYVFGILMVNLNLPFIVALLLATVIVGVVAFVIGWIVLDLDDQAVLVATLSFATIGFYLVTTEKWLTKGVVGLGTVPFPFDFGTSTELVFLLFMMVLTSLVVIYARRIRSQPFGRLLVGIRDNEGLARSLGKPTFRQKLVIFTVTSALMGLFGGLSASLNHFLVRRVDRADPRREAALGGRPRRRARHRRDLRHPDRDLRADPDHGSGADDPQHQVHALRPAPRPRDHVPARGDPGRACSASAPA